MARKLKYPFDQLVNAGDVVTIENAKIATVSPSATTYAKRHGFTLKCRTGANGSVVVTRK